MQFFQTKDLDNEIKKCFIDNETSLNNSVGLLYLMENLQRQYERYEENWSFIVFSTDIDKNTSSNCPDMTQKDINKAVSLILKKICRTSDITAFCGNDIFCILTRVFEGDDTVQFANKIFRNLNNIEYKGCTISINAKFGIAFSKHNDTIESFVSRGKNALEKAINADKNIMIGV